MGQIPPKNTGLILATSISRSISKAHTAYRLQLSAAFQEARIDITPDMYLILRCLWESEGVNQQELADQTAKDKASLTKLINNLESRKLVRRTHDSQDRRNKLIMLTPKGRKLKDKVYPLALEIAKTAEKSISRQQIDATRVILETIYDNIKR